MERTATTDERIFSEMRPSTADDLEKKAYAVVMRAPILYWSVIGVYLAELLDMECIADWFWRGVDQKNISAEVPLTMIALPMRKYKAKQLEEFCEKELPGMVRVVPFLGYCEETLGASLEDLAEYMERTGKL